MAEKKIELSPKHQIFVDAYFETMNATKAYKVAYPDASMVSCAANGSKLLNNVNIREYIRLRLREKHASVDEVLAQLGEITRSKVDAFYDENLDVTLFDFDKQGKPVAKPEIKFVKKIKQKTTTDKFGAVTVTTEIELEDRDAARDKILRVAGAYKDNLNITDNEIEIDLIMDDKDES